MFRNISFATIGSLRDVLDLGEDISVRGSEIKELRNRVTVLQFPLERCLFVPKRRNNIIATVAETFWVLAGRDDVSWLTKYLPRAKDFSDDGIVWRGAYGPRLRKWSGIDQLKETRRLLVEEAASRRAVMSLFDPAVDYIVSKDIPCNNWLHWLKRNNALHLNVAIRSNDIVWGFSGVNSFTWSVLQQLMAIWTNSNIGELTFFASSFHIYERHCQMATDAISAFRGINCYDYEIPAISISTPFEAFDSKLSLWFELENDIGKSYISSENIRNIFGDSFFSVTLAMCYIFLGINSGWTDRQISCELATLERCDLVAALYEHIGRIRPNVLLDIPDQNIRTFLKDYNGYSQ